MAWIFSATAFLGPVFLSQGILAADASARTLMVGADQQYKSPSAAVAAAAQDGDRVSIAPGEYFDCTAIRQNNLVIEGTGPGVILTDKSCAGKALLITDGNDITIRNLTLQRARVADGNGAGIRAEGGNLRIEKVRFINNQNGILAADNPNATIEIHDSEFIGNGSCAQGCAHAIYVGVIKRLLVDHTRVFATKEGHGIKSRALRTEVTDSVIADGPDGTSSYSINIPNGGATVITGNKIEKGPNSGNYANTVSIGEEGVDRPTSEITITDNHLTNDEGDRSTTFIKNLTATPAVLKGNTYSGQVRPLVGDGSQR